MSNIRPNQHLILTPTFNHPKVLPVFLNAIIDLLEKSPNTYLVLLDNNSDTETKKTLKDVKHPQIETHFLDENIGKGNAINNYISTHITKKNCPLTITSLDPDVTFSKTSFDALVDAVQKIPKIGVLGMRYTKNKCNPERRVFFKRTYTGTNNTPYTVAIPFLCNVAGPIITLNREVLIQALNFEYYPKSKGKTYYPDDAFLHDKLRKLGYRYGYLEGTEATHLKDRFATIVDESIAHLYTS